MGISFFLLILSLCSLLLIPSSASFYTLNEGSSLSVENPEDVLVSPDGVFSAGFYRVGYNAYCFAIWFSNPSCANNNCTLVWMANRDFPVNGKRSKFLLQKTGNLVLTDADKSTVWSTDTVSPLSTALRLDNTGNLVLRDIKGVVLWQSLDSPTDTLLPWQQLSRDLQLVSSRSKSNFSSGFYKLFFDNDNLLRLLYDGPDVSSIYWPYPWLADTQVGRFTYNSTRIALFDSLGMFTSSDNFTFQSADYGVRLQRRLKLDSDGNVRLYSREQGKTTWVVSWQAISDTCAIHGICGPNSTCSYDPVSGRKCSCLPGYKLKSSNDWSDGCEPEFKLSCGTDHSEIGFIELTHVEFYGYDFGFHQNTTLEQCEQICLQLCDCKGFQLKIFGDGSLVPNCFPKTLLLNGKHTPGFDGDFYVKVPKTSLFSINKEIVSGLGLDCSGELVAHLDRAYSKSHENQTLKSMLWFACALGVFEIIGILFVWCFLIRSHKDLGEATQGYQIAATGFKRFTYSELKKATKDFSEEIGRGAGGIVYKGTLSDNRVAAIKRLNVAVQGEAEFLAEVSTIGKLNHMNLIDIWGYCAEGKHRLLVYEHMEHGSLIENLSSKSLDWQKRFEIALGTAKGLAYLHEECLEWVLHCDVKPQNILLDSNYQPKVSDFGLSKLLNRSGDLNNSSFSRIRGTRGYMAPEWVFNLPITSKVDVYSYGIVVLEMLTGKSPAMGIHSTQNSGELEQKRLVTWVRDKRNGANGMPSWIEAIIDPTLEGEYDKTKMEILVKLALQCVEEDKDVRPTMSKVVEMLLHQKNDY